MNQNRRQNCPDCEGDFSRRDFVKTVGVAAIAAAPLGFATGLHAAPKPDSAAETTVGKLYQSLSDEQKKAICFGFDDPKRTKISANWKITEQTIGSDFYSMEQRDLIDQIVRGVCSEEGYERIKKQMEVDYGGFGRYSIAIFGQPGDGKFQWELTGRHLTMRADGDSVPGAAFGGPIVYGHGASDPAQNLYHYQTKATNEVFAALDPDQRKQALQARAPQESQVQLQGESGKFPGIGVGELSSDQQELVEKVLKTLLSPYRTEDVDEAMAVLKQGGGLKTLHMAFYQQGDLQDDSVWDIWRVEGPSFVWHFRGAPHVHTYVNIGIKADS